ncbi:hypothetical protein [Rhizobium rhizoryzae]|uniref:hypothetical protein n=1 Tax=Rhizobium rhizoryzae TaxID=451876 RepID=UPI00289DBBC1|nr:hypothetical protein [Rhizobium rhizoryzae]
MISVITPPQPFVTPADIPGAHAPDDPAITAMIAAAVGEIDGPYGWLRRSIGKQTLELSVSPIRQVIALPLPPIIAVLSVKAIGMGGIEATLDPSQYGIGRETLHLQPSIPASSCSFLRIRYTAGFSEADGTGPIPPQVRQAVIMAVQNMKALAAENLFLRAEEIEGVGRKEYTVSEAAGNIIRETSRRLLRGLKVATS